MTVLNDCPYVKIKGWIIDIFSILAVENLFNVILAIYWSLTIFFCFEINMSKNFSHLLHSVIHNL